MDDDLSLFYMLRNINNGVVHIQDRFSQIFGRIKISHHIII